MQNDLADLIKIFKALGNERRLQIIELLIYNNSQAVSDISNALKIPFNTTSRHLLILANARLLCSKQIKTEVIYSLNTGLGFRRNKMFFALIKKAYDIEDLKKSSGRLIYGNPLIDREEAFYGKGKPS